MDISTQQNGPAPGINPSPKSPESAANSFAAFIDPALGTFVVADSSPAGQDSEAAAAARKDIDFIRQNGLLAFIDEVHKRKLEELRAGILGTMGLSEESLAEMSADQRGLIEKMIAERIQQKLAAEAAMKNGHGGGEPLDQAENPSIAANPAGQAGLQNLMGHGGMQVGLAISDAVSGTGNSERTDRQNLPE